MDTQPVPKKRKAQVIFAYEPIWAIGGQEPASAEYVCAVVDGLKAKVQLFLQQQPGSEALIGQISWLYGGSAGPGTWKGLKNSCDGLFLGRFAHKPENFVECLNEMMMEKGENG